MRNIIGRLRKPGVALCVAASVSGCGFAPPRIQEPWEQGPNSLYEFEHAIKKSIYCNIREAVFSAFDDDTLAKAEQRYKDHQPDYFIDFGVQVTLSLQVDELTSFNPGASLITPMHAGVTNFNGEFFSSSTSPLASTTYGLLNTPQNYTLGLGGTASTHATTTHKYNFFYSVRNLYEDHKHNPARCKPDNERIGASFLITNSDKDELGIGEWLESALQLEKIERGEPVEATTKAKTRKKVGGAIGSTARIRQVSEVSQSVDYSGTMQTLIPETNPAISGVQPKPNQQLKVAQKSKKPTETPETPKPPTDYPKIGESTEEVLTYEVKFDVVTSGNVTPSWKLVRVASNQGGAPLFNTQRERTHDLTITFAPCSDYYGAKHSSCGPSPAGVASQQAQQVGLAVANAIKANQ